MHPFVRVGDHIVRPDFVAYARKNEGDTFTIQFVEGSGLNPVTAPASEFDSFEKRLNEAAANPS